MVRRDIDFCPLNLDISGQFRLSSFKLPLCSCGAVAQLGERLNGIQEVEGSIPFGSTKFLNLNFCFGNAALCVWSTHPVRTGDSRGQIGFAPTIEAVFVGDAAMRIFGCQFEGLAGQFDIDQGFALTVL